MPLLCLAGPGSRHYPLPTSGDGFLAAGHWDAAELTMRLVYPRPNAETPTWARHRWAYYDAANPVPYEIDIGVIGGAWPYVYELVDGPTGMAIGRAYGNANYGKLTWTPGGSVADDPVHVRVTDQAGTQIDVQFTISTSSSLSVFCFIATTGNDTTGDGSYGAPLQTPLGLFGATAGALTDFPNAILYFRTGTYDWFAQDTTLGARIQKDRTPMAMLGFPGETVTHDIASTGARWLDCSVTDCNDFFLRGFSFSGTKSVTNFRYIYFGAASSRVTFGHLDLPNVYAGSNPTDNATFAFFNSNVAIRQYIFAHDYTETNRTGSNSGGCYIAFGCQYMLAQRVTTTGSNAQFDCLFKASCLDCEWRESLIDRRTGSGYNAVFCQIDNGVATDRVQVRHVRFLGGTFALNDAMATTVGELFVNRCTVTGGGTGGSINVNTSGTGPVAKIKNCVIQANAGVNPIQEDRGNNAISPSTTVEGTECHGHTSDAIVDSDGLLTGAYRTNYYGTANSRGAEIT